MFWFSSLEENILHAPRLPQIVTLTTASVQNPNSRLQKRTHNNSSPLLIHYYKSHIILIPKHTTTLLYPNSHIIQNAHLLRPPDTQDEDQDENGDRNFNINTGSAPPNSYLTPFFIYSLSSLKRKKQTLDH